MRNLTVCLSACWFNRRLTKKNVVFFDRIYLYIIIIIFIKIWSKFVLLSLLLGGALRLSIT